MKKILFLTLSSLLLVACTAGTSTSVKVDSNPNPQANGSAQTNGSASVTAKTEVVVDEQKEVDDLGKSFTNLDASKDFPGFTESDLTK